MKNLIIGNTSQQSYYYPDDYLRISSRNMDIEGTCSKKFDSVYITFAEQRIYEDNIDYIGTNFNYTMEIIENMLDVSNRIVIFTSCELWSNEVGTISINTNPNFDIRNGYTISKLLLFNKIKELRNKDNRYKKVVLIHPFYFNSIHRRNYFLFGKIFDSIVNEKRIEVGNLDFYRDMVHTEFLVEKCIQAECDMMLGAGRLFNVRDFVIELYRNFDMSYTEYVKEDRSNKPNDKFIRADVSWNYSYEDLLKDTIKDIENAKKNGR